MAITIPYLLLTIIFHALIFSHAGFNSDRRSIGIISIRFTLYPSIIELIILGFFMHIIDRSIFEQAGYIRLLYYMLVFYASFPGALWLAIKWNLFWALWKRPLVRNKNEQMSNNE
jgi:hypothetical protein